MSFRKSLFSGLILILGLISTVEQASAQGIGAVYIGAPKAIVVSGEQIQLTAAARDTLGRLRTGDTFTFTSSNTSIVSVSPTGVATAGAIGVASVTARTGNVNSAGVSLQVVPSRIEVTADRYEIGIGEQVQMYAAALDINGVPIPGASIRWQVTGATGFSTRAAAVEPNGVLSAYSLGLMTVRAQIVYSGQSSAHVPTYEGWTHITITPRREYRLTRLLENKPLVDPLRLRPAYNSEFGVNDRGQIAFTANLEGQASALLLYDSGRFETLVSAGTPGPMGGYIWHFEGPPSINNRGQVLARVATRNSWGLVLASREEGASFIVEGGSEGPFERMGYFRSGRHSLNDNGDIVFLSDFAYSGDSLTRTGLFLLKDGVLSSVWTTADPLPSFPSSFFFDNTNFGLDSSGAVYFRVLSGASSAIYRRDSNGALALLAGTGSVLSGGAVRAVENVAISPSGVIAFGLRFVDGTAGAARWNRGSLNTLALRDLGQVLSVNDRSDVLYYGNPESLWSLYSWGSDSALVMDVRIALEGGDTINWVKTGKITGNGDVFISAQSPQTDLLVLKPGSPTKVLWKTGSQVTVRPSVNFLGPVYGAMSGPVHVLAGGANVSVMEVTANGALQPVWVPGDRPLAGFSNFVINYVTKAPGGEIYLAVGDGIMRFNSGRAESVLRYPAEVTVGPDPFVARSNANWFDGSNTFAVNSSGQMVLNVRTDTQQRLVVYGNGELRSIMTQGGTAATPSPSGGVFTGIYGGFWRQAPVAIDDQGRVLVHAFVSGGRSGLFLYEGGRWRAVALIGGTSMDGSIVSSVRAIRGANRNFYAIIDLANGNTVIAQYDGLNWTTLVRRSDIMPDGTELTSINSTLAANRRGDIAFTVSANSQKIIVRTADGVNHIVYTEMTLTDSSDRFVFQPFDFDLRDDGRLFFVGVDSLDRNMVYLAEPLF